ncbi:MAG: PAS domain-containing protein [Haloferacaceae archaeon]
MQASDGSIRILHVDDDPDFTELTVSFLEREDDRFAVETATSVGEGTSRLADVDCVVSDYDMPGRDGIDFLETVREERPELPFILFTGKGSEEIASEAISSGVTGYLQKGSGTGQYAVLANRIRNAVAGYRARREAERRAGQLAQIKRYVTDVVWISTPDKSSMDFISDSYRDVWGRPPESITEEPTSFVDAIHPEDRDRVRDALAEQRDDPDGYEETYRVVHPDGEVRWVNDRASGVYEDGTLTRTVGIATDITDLKEYERELHEERAFTRSALRIAVDFYWMITLDGHVSRWSDTDGAITGYTEEEAIGLHTSTFHPDEHFSRIERAIDEMKRTGSVVVEADLLTKGGERIPYEFAGSVITDENGDVQSMCGVGRDVSDRTQ